MFTLLEDYKMKIGHQKHPKSRVSMGFT